MHTVLKVFMYVIAFTVNEVAAEVSRDQGGKGPT
jgi:hypothetical protein